mmetsp:Transcript_36528/g.77714  ORF Transcript_36528/g.77714 Transcript_36528/m.77714 type:complete len:223 (-) Transcript_36528:306-974(-)
MNLMTQSLNFGWVGQLPENLQFLCDSLDELIMSIATPLLWKASDGNPRVPDLWILRAISCDMTARTAGEASQSTDRLPSVWMSVDAGRVLTVLTELADTLSWVFIQISPSRMDVEAILSLAPSAKLADDRRRIVQYFSALWMNVWTDDTPANTAIVAHLVGTAFHFLHLNLQLFDEAWRDRTWSRGATWPLPWRWTRAPRWRRHVRRWWQHIWRWGKPRQCC